MRHAGAALLAKSLPDQYFRNENEVRSPKAPAWFLFIAFLAENAVAVATLVFFTIYFSQLATVVTTISPSIVKSQDCLALNPKKGTTYYSKLHSENAQFASPNMKSQQCVELLTTTLNVCADGKRNDHITVWGVTNPENPQYHSSGYFSFSPTQTQGLTTILAPFFGISVSFPKPVISVTFTGSDSNWYIFNFASKTIGEAFTSIATGTVSSFLVDTVGTKVYDPVAKHVDISLSGSINASASDVLASLGTQLNNVKISHIGVFDGIYYGEIVGAVLNDPHGMTFDSKGNMIVSDSGHNLVRRFDASTGISTDLGTTASTPISAPGGVTVDPADNVWIADTGNKRVLCLDEYGIFGAAGAIVNYAPSLWNSPVDLKVFNGLGDQHWYLYVSDYGRNQVVRVDLNTGTDVIIGDNPKHIDTVADIAIDGGGYLYVADPIDNQVHIFDPAGAWLKDFGGINGVWGIAVHSIWGYSDNYIIVSDIYVNKIFKIVTSTEDRTVLVSGVVPRGLYLGGFLYFAVSGTGSGANTIRRLSMLESNPSIVGYRAHSQMFSWDTRNPNVASSYQLWPSAMNANIGGIFAPLGECSSVNGVCNSVIHAEQCDDSKLLYVQVQSYWFGQENDAYIYCYDPAAKALVSTVTNYFSSYSTSRHIAGVISVRNKDAISRDVVYTKVGAIDASTSEWMKSSAYTALVTAAGTQVTALSKIPGAKKQTLVATASSSSNTCCLTSEGSACSLTCPTGAVVSQILFADFGAPTGSCGTFSIANSCSAAGSVSGIVTAACVGNAACSVSSSTAVFGDPCPGTAKRLAIQISCTYIVPTPAPSAAPTPAPTTSAVFSTTEYSRFLLLTLKQKGFYSTFIYDAFTDTYFSNSAAAATTHDMLAYTWGVCNGNVTRGLVELTFSNDYSNECQLPNTGLYYQSPNQYFVIPYSCLGVPYDKLLTDCPEVKANMKSLVDSTCAASIPKVCQQQYELNPPFSWVTNIYSSPLTILSLAASNTMALYGLFTFFAAFMIRRVYAQYKASNEEMQALNPQEELGTLICAFFLSFCGYRAVAKHDDDEKDEKGEMAAEETIEYVDESGRPCDCNGNPLSPVVAIEMTQDQDSNYDDWNSEVDSNAPGDASSLHSSLTHTNTRVKEKGDAFEYLICGLAPNQR